MENQSTRRLSRLFPSPFKSCRFRYLSDAVHNSIVFTAGNSDCSSFRTSSSLSKPRKISLPPATGDSPNLKTFNSDQKIRPLFVKNSSSSNGGWFSSDEEEDGGEDEEALREGTESFFSLSSVSSDSSRRRIKKSQISEQSRRRIRNPVRRRTKTAVAELGCRHFSDQVPEIQKQSSIYRRETGEKNRGHRRKTPKPCRRSNSTCFPENPVRRRTNTAVSELGCRHFADQVPEIQKQSSIFRSETGEKNRGHRRKTPKPRRRSSSTCFPENPTDVFYSTSKDHRKSQRSNVRRCSVVVGDRVEQSFAVMKASSDPYGDFRESMVDMIVEKEIYRIEDLQKLLDRFLSLNSSHHHGIILEVFSEICQVLIAD